MKTKTLMAAMLAAGLIAGFAAGRIVGGADCPQAAVDGDERRVEGNAPDQGGKSQRVEGNAPVPAVSSKPPYHDDERRVEGNAPYQAADADRIAALEKALAEAREREAKQDALLAKAGEAVAKALESQGASAVSAGTDLDILAELRNNLSEDEFNAATNALAGMRVKAAERAKGRLDYLSSVDVSRMSKAERGNHKKFMELLGRRDAAMAKMKGGIPDAKTLEEVMGLELEMASAAKTERSALVREVARELGFTGGDVETFHDALDAVYDATSGGGLADLADGNGGDGDVQIQTQVIGL